MPITKQLTKQQLQLFYDAVLKNITKPKNSGAGSWPERKRIIGNLHISLEGDNVVFGMDQTYSEDGDTLVKFIYDSLEKTLTAKFSSKESGKTLWDLPVPFNQNEINRDDEKTTGILTNNLNVNWNIFDDCSEPFDAALTTLATENQATLESKEDPQPQPPESSAAAAAISSVDEESQPDAPVRPSQMPESKTDSNDEMPPLEDANPIVFEEPLSIPPQIELAAIPVSKEPHKQTSKAINELIKNITSYLQRAVLADGNMPSNKTLTLTKEVNGNDFIVELVNVGARSPAVAIRTNEDTIVYFFQDGNFLFYDKKEGSFDTRNDEQKAEAIDRVEKFSAANSQAIESLPQLFTQNGFVDKVIKAKENRLKSEAITSIPDVIKQRYLEGQEKVGEKDQWKKQKKGFFKRLFSPDVYSKTYGDTTVECSTNGEVSFSSGDWKISFKKEGKDKLVPYLKTGSKKQKLRIGDITEDMRKKMEGFTRNHPVTIASREMPDSRDNRSPTNIDPLTKSSEVWRQPSEEQPLNKDIAADPQIGSSKEEKDTKTPKVLAAAVSRVASERPETNRLEKKYEPQNHGKSSRLDKQYDTPKKFSSGRFSLRGSDFFRGNIEKLVTRELPSNEEVRDHVDKHKSNIVPLHGVQLTYAFSSEKPKIDAPYSTTITPVPIITPQILRFTKTEPISKNPIPLIPTGPGDSICKYSEFLALELRDSENTMGSGLGDTSKAKTENIQPVKLRIFEEVNLFFSSFRKCNFVDIDFSGVKDMETASFINCSFNENCKFPPGFQFKLSQFFTSSELKSLAEVVSLKDIKPNLVERCNKIWESLVSGSIKIEGSNRLSKRDLQESMQGSEEEKEQKNSEKKLKVLQTLIATFKEKGINKDNGGTEYLSLEKLRKAEEVKEHMSEFPPEQKTPTSIPSTIVNDTFVKRVQTSPSVKVL